MTIKHGRKDEVIALYTVNKLSCRQIATQLGCCETTVLRVLKSNKVAMRPSGAVAGRPTKKNTMPDKPVYAPAEVLSYMELSKLATVDVLPKFKSPRAFINFKRMKLRSED